MRIGVDMLGVQSPHHGHRGIGRYGINLISSLLARPDGHEYVLYVHEYLPDSRVPRSDRATVRILGQESEFDGGTVAQRVDRLTRTNPDGLDLFLVLSAFEPWASYCPPARPLGGLKMAAVIYDLIPFLFPAENVYDPVLMRYYRSLDHLRRYDVLLAISEATRQDCLTTLGLSGHQVVSIGAGCDRSFFVPDTSPTAPEASRQVLERLGIHRPFVLNVGGLVERKNTRGLLDAFARLPERLRTAYQIVLTFSSGEPEFAEIRKLATRLGIVDSMVWTKEVSDETLRVLYQRCAAFVLPSHYEGFGLPLLEAMQCGAPVIAGNNSSQIEVVGDAGLLANVSDPSDIAAKLAQILDDPALSRTLRERASVQSQQFSWDLTAERASAALGSLGRYSPVKPRRVRSTLEKPRIAFFSPLPPRKSGISDYSALLLGELSKMYTIDLFHDVGYRPDLALNCDDFDCIDARLFGLHAGTKNYHAICYQMGNSRYHSYLYETMLRYPGIATLHDFCLAGFHLHYGHARGLERDYIRNELLLWYPEHEAEILAMLRSIEWEWEIIARECARRGWYLNRRLFDSPNIVMVHSPWCLEQVRTTRPEHAERAVVIPHGIWPRQPSPADKAAIRDRFNLPEDAFLVASFGFIHPDKMNPEALDAFRGVAAANDKAMFLFVGEDADGGIARRKAAELGLMERVRFMGRQSWDSFIDLIAVTDLGVNLRLPPTNGETSGALLNMLAAGVPTIVTDVATFSDYPAHVVRKVRWEADGIDGLRRALVGLANDPAERAALGRAAWQHTVDYHEWPRVARQYADLIERCHREQVAAGKVYQETQVRLSKTLAMA